MGWDVNIELSTRNRQGPLLFGTLEGELEDLNHGCRFFPLDERLLLTLNHGSNIRVYLRIFTLQSGEAERAR